MRRRWCHTAIAGLKTGTIRLAGLASFAGCRANATLRFSRTTCAVPTGWRRGLFNGHCVSALQSPTPCRLIRHVDHGVVTTPYVELVLANDFLISGYSVDFLVVSTANDVVTGVAALPDSSVKT